MSRTEEALRRHARYYCDVLRRANRLYAGGGAGLKEFDRERFNIEKGFEWVVAPGADTITGAAALCSSYASGGAHLLSLREHPRECLHWFTRALDATRRAGDREAEVSHLENIGVAYGNMGDPHASIEYHERQLSLAREIGSRFAEAHALGQLGAGYVALSEHGRAVELYEQ